MRVAIVDSQVSFFHGGAEMLATRLGDAVRALGHDVEFVRLPLNPADPGDILRVIDFSLGENLARWIAAPDVVIALRFPGYLVQHPAKRVWLLHQFRQYYEFYEQTRAAGNSAAVEAARARIVDADRAALSGAERVWALSKRVAGRLEKYNAIPAPPPLYPPPPFEQDFYCAKQERYVFAPSRLEQHKRQWLLIEAMQHVKSDVKAVIGGEGGAHEDYRRRIGELGLADRVLLTGQLAREVQAAWYANALAVFFGPHDEDYGFVTLEAMASAKPVITCDDSGGVLEFVEDGVTGAVVPADARAIAERIDSLAANAARAKDMGQAGLSRYRKLGLSWESTASTLLERGTKP
jgi:glycosyltransferase involved in cell wall biosynthesis